MPSGKTVWPRLARPIMLVPALALLALAALAGCQGSPSALNPQSPQAGSISTLAWTLFFIALPVFLLVEALLLFTVLRFRNRRGAEEPPQIEGNRRVEILWTAAPGVVLLIVLWVTFQTMAFVLESPPESMQVQVIGHRYWWEVKYPSGNFTTANEIHVPVGQTVRVDLTSIDVIHSFWVPELSGKVDMIPGHQNHAVFRALNVGTHRGQCAEYCGVDHAYMGFLVFADSPTTFAAWVQNEQQPAAQPTTAAARQGQELFASSACIGCHTVVGTPVRGVIGPDLTHVGSRTTIGANLLPNTPANVARWIADPQQVKPGNAMPNLHLRSDVVDKLAAYLESLK